MPARIERDGGPRRPWFRPKRFGFGWTPATWQGWLVTIGGAGLIALVATLIRR